MALFLAPSSHGKILMNSVILKGCKKIAFSIIQVKYLSVIVKRLLSSY